MTVLAIALTIIFISSLATLIAELLYVLWRRRVFHRRTQSLTTFHGAAAPAVTVSQASSDTSSALGSFSSPFSKELLYFFSLNKKENSRVQPESASTNLNSNSSAPDDEMEVIDVFKLQRMYSRVLFTIKEEDREADIESDKSMCSSAEKGTEKHGKRTTLEDCLKFKLDDREKTLPELKMDVGDVHDRINMVVENEITPFATPSESPSFFTATASPTREADISVQKGPCDE